MLKLGWLDANSSRENNAQDAVLIAAQTGQGGGRTLYPQQQLHIVAVSMQLLLCCSGMQPSLGTA